MNCEWEGGLPPVGAECEYSFNMFDDESMTIPATFIGMDGRAAVIKVCNPNRKYTSTTLDCLRPIKSKAEKLRDEQIEKFKQAVFRGNGFALGETKETAIAVKAINSGCRMTRELTPEAIDKILNCGTPMTTVGVMEMVAAYVRGEMEL